MIRESDNMKEKTETIKGKRKINAMKWNVKL